MRKLLYVVVVIVAVASRVFSWDPQPNGWELIEAPENHTDPVQVSVWREKWQIWRQMELQNAHYQPNDVCTGYNMPQLKWAQRSLVQTQVMMHDRFLYDRQLNTYTVSRFLKDINSRYGQLDSVLLWPSYPNSGIDNRNQWDWFRTLPGGIDAFRKLVDEFHQHQVKVFLPYNPWDTQTRDEIGHEESTRIYKSDVSALYDLIKKTGADAFNGDTLYGVPKPFFDCKNPTVICPEGGTPSSYISHNVMSWGYYYGFKKFPPVSRPKFLESRHMVLVNARWSLDRIKEIQMAFFNAVGYETWENVWGIWNGMSLRSSEAVRRLYYILRFFPDAITSPLWEPYTSTLHPNLMASKFPVPKQNYILYTVISTSEFPLINQQLITIPVNEKHRQQKYYDVYHGKEIFLSKEGTIRIDIEENGFGSILVLKNSDALENLGSFLDSMKKLTAIPLNTISNKPVMLQQKMNTLNNDYITKPSTAYLSKADSMVYVQGTKSWNFVVSGVQIEPVPLWTPNTEDYGVDVQFPWESRPWKNHSVSLYIQDFYMDQYPVTNHEYYIFLQSSGYSPSDKSNFLKNWANTESKDVKNWMYPLGSESKPVTYISVEDARAYAKFYNKRLPHDWEWQYAASNGLQYHKYPWGDKWDDTKIPSISRGKTHRPNEDVGQHASSCVGGDPKNVCDLVGYIWQMTDEFCDAHTCGLLLRGGSSYKPIATTHFDPNWYFPQAYSNFEHSKFLMMSPSNDRSAMVGFRCVMDAPIKQP